MEKREEKIDEEEEGNAQAMHSGEGGKEDVVSDEEGRERQGGEEEDKREEREDTRSGDRDKEGQGKKGKEGQEERERGTGEVCLLCQSNRLIETFHIQPLPIIPSSSSSFSPCPSSFLSSSSFWEKFYFSSSSSPSGSSRRPCLLGPYVDKELGGALHSLKANALIEKMTEEEEEEEEEEKREKESQDRITSQTGDRIEKREDQEEEGEEKREQKKIKRKRRSKRISVHVADQFCLNFVEKNFTYAMMDISTMVDCIKQQERLSRIPNSSSSSLSSSPSLSSSATSSCSSLPSSSSSSAASSSLPSSSPSSSPACPSSSSSTCHGRKTYYYYRSLGKRPAKDCASLEALGSGVCTAFSLPPDLQLARANEIFRTSFSPKKEREEEEKEQQQEEENDSTASEERKEETHQKKKKTEKEKKEELKRQKEKEKEKEKQDEVLCFHSSVLRVAQRGIELWTHYDIPDNFLVQIAGRKRIFLFPPSCVNDLYIRGSSSPIEGLVSGLSEKTLENFPRVTQGLKKAFYCDVTPGYILFLPSLWIHAVFMLPPLHELCQTCRATIQSRISSSSSSFSSFFSSPLHSSSSSPSSSGSLCSSSSASCESRDSSIQAGEKKKQNHLLDGGEEEEACCVSVNVFFLDRSLPSHEKIYAKKDIYGNKDGSAYTEALNDVQRTILPRLSNLPSPWSSFYLRKLSLELESMAEALEKREEGGG